MHCAIADIGKRELPGFMDPPGSGGCECIWSAHLIFLVRKI